MTFDSTFIKKDKDRRDISKWRPISLINVDVKIGSKAIAKRLENVLPSIIHHNQSAYVKDRTIFDAVRTIEDIMDYRERYKISGKMICIDFKKAFDSVSRTFLFRTLSTFCFGPSFIQWIHTFYKNISSCIMNNGFSTALFDVQRGVRQGDPLSAYLFITVLEILTVSIRSDQDIEGILVDKKEIKVGLFADDLTALLRNDISLLNFLRCVDNFGACSCLNINYDKSEILLLGDLTNSALEYTLLQNIAVKKSVKILGVHFTYNHIAKRKLNFDDLIISIKEKLKMWRWRDLTIIGRIQIVKTFIIPIFLYRASLSCVDKEFMNDVNKIIFEFIWKGKDKVKRSALISDIEYGGLKAPHLDSIIKAQRIMCCKKFASVESRRWTAILLHYLRPVGGKLILGCNFDVTKLPIKLPPFYEDCLKCFAKCSVENQDSLQYYEDANPSRIILWNNKFIRINGKSVYNSRLANAGIIRLGYLITENNDFVTNSRVRELNMSPLDAFNIASLIDALPVQWRQSLRTCMSTINEPFILENYILLSLNGQNVSISKAVSKIIYKELRDRIITPPTAQFKYNAQLADDELDWRKIYSLPHRVALDSKSREFQYKLLNRCLATNVFLSKISIVASPLCSFCGVMDESLEHIFVSCHYTEKFWAEVIKWLGDHDVRIELLYVRSFSV